MPEYAPFGAPQGCQTLCKVASLQSDQRQESRQPRARRRCGPARTPGRAGPHRRLRAGLRPTAERPAAAAPRGPRRTARPDRRVGQHHLQPGRADDPPEFRHLLVPPAAARPVRTDRGGADRRRPLAPVAAPVGGQSDAARVGRGAGRPVRGEPAPGADRRPGGQQLPALARRTVGRPRRVAARSRVQRRPAPHRRRTGRPRRSRPRPARPVPPAHPSRGHAAGGGGHPALPAARQRGRRRRRRRGRGNPGRAGNAAGGEGGRSGEGG